MERSLGDRVSAFPTTSGNISATEVDALWGAITADDPDLASELREFALVVHEQLMEEADALEFGLGAWELNLRTAMAQTILCGSAVAVLLNAFGVTDLPAAVIATVVPVLFDVKTVRLDRNDDILLLELQRKVDDDGIARTAAELYHEVDRRTRKQISRAQFERFLDALVEAGAADRSGHGRFRIGSADRPAFLRVTIR